MKLREAWLASEKRQLGSKIDIQRKDEQTLMLSIKHFRLMDLIEICAAVNIQIENIHLQQVGRLDLGDLRAGDYLELKEKDLRL